SPASSRRTSLFSRPRASAVSNVQGSSHPSYTLTYSLYCDGVQSGLMKHVYRLAVAAALVLSGAGCSKSETAQARSRESAAKAVRTETVRKDSVRRAVDVVGTLAAVDEVTISSEAEGKVSRILADLGDRVTAGQLLIQLDNEKQQYTYAQQQAALQRTL